MHFVYEFYDGNVRDLVAEYGESSPNRKVPHRNVFHNTHRSLRKTGFSP
jgi:hypothetical protein